MIKRNYDRHQPKDTRDATWRRFPALATYRTYPSATYGGFTGQVRDTEVEVVFVTRGRYVIKALTDMTICSPTRELKAGKTALVPKPSITFKEPTT